MRSRHVCCEGLESRRLWSAGLLANIAYSSSTLPHGWGVANGQAYFFAQVDTLGGITEQLWTTTGLPGTTHRVADINFNIGYSYSHDPVAAGPLLYFTARTSDAEDELWRTDGTEAGTFPVSEDIDFNVSWSYNRESAAAGASLLFAAPHQTEGPELWVSNGTVAGTQLLVDLYPSDDSHSSPTNFTSVGAGAFFSVAQGLTNDLWYSDGTAGGTDLIMSLPGTMLTVAGGDSLFYFMVFDFQTSETELWRSDGTAAGTMPLGDAYVYNAYTFTDGPLAVVQDTAYFQAPGDTPDTTRLWKSSGTVAGTIPVETTDGPANTVIAAIERFGNQILFLRSDGSFDPQSTHPLWVSNGTAGGTSQIGAVSGAGLDLDFRIVGTDSAAFFPSAGVLWQTDGTMAGTRPVRDPVSGVVTVIPAFADLIVGSSIAFQNSLLFFGADTTDSAGIQPRRANVPDIVSSEYRFADPTPTVRMLFSDDINGSLTNTDLTLLSLPSLQTVATTLSVSYVASTRTAEVGFSGPLPNGRYRLTLPAGAVQTTVGVASFLTLNADFFVLAGDVNHDGVVDILDLRAVANNWQQAGRTFAQGDLNHDTLVNQLDLNILAANWQQTPDGPLAGPVLPMPTLTPIIPPSMQVTVATLGKTPPKRTALRAIQLI